MNSAQPGILDPIPPLSRYLCFNLTPEASAGSLGLCLSSLELEPSTVIGLGTSLVDALNGQIDGLKTSPSYSSMGIDITSTPHALWIWLRGNDRGVLLHQSRQLIKQLTPDFKLEDTVDGFTYRHNRDLTGYEDGTENPEAEDAEQAALSQDPKLLGSSFVAVQQWQHDMDRFEAMPSQQQDLSIGRRQSDNEELLDAPASAHVKRTAQESFDPEAFLLRRSMPWADDQAEGLMFVAFGATFAPFEAQLKRMIGIDDGIVDALFQFTRPRSSSYYWCPALKQGQLDLSPLNL